MKLGKSYLNDVAYRALEMHNYVQKNNCDSINNEILYTIENLREINREIPAVQKCSVKGKKHFIAMIPADLYANADEEEGTVIIDAALKQFENFFNEDIDEVVILPPQDERRNKYYDVVPESPYE